MKFYKKKQGDIGWNRILALAVALAVLVAITIVIMRAKGVISFNLLKIFG